MIVRISGEDQYRVDEGADGRLHELDTDVIAAVHAGDEAAFAGKFAELLDYVRAQGTRVGRRRTSPSRRPDVSSRARA